MRIARVLLGGIVALIALSWTTSLVTRTGILVWSSTMYEDDIYNLDPVDHGGGAPTYGPVGRQCVYFTYAGAKDVFFVGTGEREYMAGRLAAGEDIDAWVSRATIMTTQDWTEDCPATFKFETQ